ncbi:MAG: hypothetical protein JXQ75_19670 [Phycisphaerae bacterium]|nr:hypothetical protein [Phycisphaerae bacterium]
MRKQLGMLCLVPALCSAMTCDITGEIRFVETETLDNADAAITITQAAGAPQATVEATITLDAWTYVQLKDTQVVEVNGEALSRTASTGLYRATIDAAETYTITVREPTRGVQDTVISSPDFNITSPQAGGTASLSGFTITWSNANANLQAEALLEQTLLGRPLSLALGPVPDAGSLAVGAPDMASAGFGQGADLTIAVTRISELGSISGFRNGTLQAQRCESNAVQPAA